MNPRRYLKNELQQALQEPLKTVGALALAAFGATIVVVMAGGTLNEYESKVFRHDTTGDVPTRTSSEPVQPSSLHAHNGTTEQYVPSSDHASSADYLKELGFAALGIPLMSGGRRGGRKLARWVMKTPEMTGPIPSRGERPLNSEEADILQRIEQNEFPTKRS